MKKRVYLEEKEEKEKENKFKLPLIQAIGTNELKRKGSFLELKDRNILKEGI